MKYTVEHYNTQGLTESASGLTKAEAKAELGRFYEDLPGTGSCSKALDESGRCVAYRHWDKKRITWIVKPTSSTKQPATAPDYPAIIAELTGAIESALLRDDIAGDEFGDVLRAAITKAEKCLQTFTI